MFDSQCYKQGNNKHKVKRISQKECEKKSLNTVKLTGPLLTLPKWDLVSSSDDDEPEDLRRSIIIRSDLEGCYIHHVFSYEQNVQRSTIYEQYVSGLLARIQRNTSRIRALDPIYVGSITEGLNIKTSDYNILVPLSVGNSSIKVTETAPGRAALKLQSLAANKEREDKWLGWRSEDGYLCPTLANNMYHTFATQWLKLRKYSDVTIEPFQKLGNHSVRVCIEQLSTPNIIIEVIPAIKLNGFPFPFVAKSFQIPADPALMRSWSMVSYEREHMLLQSIDKADYKCRSKALCIFKSLRQHDDVIAFLSTYQMKTCLLHMCDGQIDDRKWRKQPLECCFLTLVRTMMEFVKTNELPHFVLEKINLFGDFNQYTLAKVYNRLNILTVRRRELNRLLSK